MSPLPEELKSNERFTERKKDVQLRRLILTIPSKVSKRFEDREESEC